MSETLREKAHDAVTPLIEGGLAEWAYVTGEPQDAIVDAVLSVVRQALADLPTWPNERADDEWANPFVKMADLLALFSVEVSG